jgi:hypothetical protein
MSAPLDNQHLKAGHRKQRLDLSGYYVPWDTVEE